MSEITRTSLAIHLEPKTLDELGFHGTQLVMTTSHQPTELPKTGLSALLAKTPFGDDKPIAIDVDVGCALYDKTGDLLETIWYGNLRNTNESVRHHGDTFIGMNRAYRPNLVEENLSVRIHSLPETVHGIGFFVHTKAQQPLAKAVFGIAYLKDNEGNLLHERAFDSLDDDAYGVCAWQLIRLNDGWQLSAPMCTLTGKNIAELSANWQPTHPA